MKKQLEIRNIKKRFGQHFLRDSFIIDKLIHIIDPRARDMVIEIGCGRGVLTEYLVKNSGKVVGIEFDRDLIPLLQQKFQKYQNFTLIQEDILKFDPRQICSSSLFPLAKAVKQREGPHVSETQKEIFRSTSEIEGGGYKLVGNIPYNLTTKLFEKILLWKPRPSIIVFMVQKEVGEKIIQKGRKNSPLAVCVNMIGEPKIILTVPPHAFYPPPKVDSVCLFIDCDKANEVERSLRWQFYDFVHKIFRMGRKTILNNLISLIPKEKALSVLIQCSLDSFSRPEHLTFEELLTLFKVMQGVR